MITSTKRFSNQVSDLYCQCTNTAECAASFVSTIGYKHTLNPPMQSVLEIVISLVDRMSQEEKAKLLGDMSR